GYGQQFSVSTPDASRIASVALLAPGAVTHAFDENARYVPLAFSVVNGALQVQAPASGNLAPPGYYMLFIVDGNGIPSVATWLRIVAGAQDTTPPSAPGVLSAAAGTGSVSLTWGAATDNVGVVFYSVHRSALSGFALAPQNLIGQSTSTTFDDTGLATGTYYYRVTANDAAGNTGPPSNEASATVMQGSAGIRLERSLSVDMLGTATLSGLGTDAPNDLLLAFVSADGPGNLPQTATVSGGGLTWTLVRRTNTQSGDSEIWAATAATPLTNASLQSVLSQSGYRQSLTVTVLSGAAGIGAISGASASSGAPSAQLTTTTAGSWVFGVGNDYDSATARALGPGQTMVHQWLETTLGDTYWVQRLSDPVATAGSVVTINDTAPTTDRWNLSIVEVVPR
ncbi:MAG TPA: galactose oxidase-like domain-containing protein, partial [Burkholderiaceae bacterium]|nr:galactose oxidase-like domain-containing protein [Burkholderiaceae bacterium]